MKKILIIDLDGTLIDSRKAHVEAFNKAFLKNNLPARLSDTIVKAFGPPSDEVVKKLFPDISERKLVKVVKDKTAILTEETAKYAKAKRGVIDMVYSLKKKYKIALVSNASKREVRALLDAAGIEELDFDLILGKEDVAAVKPDPAPIEQVKKTLKRQVAYVIGDTIYDIKAGRAANCKTIAVLDGIQGIKLLGGENPTIIIKTIDLLPEILE
jgi:phosphoglycolate phosphatase